MRTDDADIAGQHVLSAMPAVLPRPSTPAHRPSTAPRLPASLPCGGCHPVPVAGCCDPGGWQPAAIQEGCRCWAAGVAVSSKKGEGETMVETITKVTTESSGRDSEPFGQDR